MSVARLVSEAELDYVRAFSVRETDVQRRLRAETERLANGSMASTPECAQLVALLVRATGARRCLEVGVFTGLTTLAMAMALPEGGTILACDIASGPAAALARRHWAEAGVADRIELRIAPAIETLDGLIAGGGGNGFDLAFIDADKTGYDAYYERSLTLVRPGGLIVIDNTLWYGSVADPSDTDASTRALRTLNAKLHRDERVDVSLLPIGDGMTLVCKRG